MSLSSRARRGRRGTLVLATADVSLDVLMRGMLRDLEENGLGPVHVAAADTGRLRRVAAREGVAAHGVSMVRDPSPWRDLVSLAQLVVLYGRLRPALMVYGTPKAALLGAVAARLTRVPARVHVLHGLRLETVHGLGRRVLLTTERIVLALSSSTVAVSASLREKCAALGLDVRRMSVLGPGGFVGLDLEEHAAAGSDDVARTTLRTEMGVGPAARLIGFAGRVTQDKGVVDLLDAMVELRRGGVVVEAAIVGADEGIGDLPQRTQLLLAEPWVHVVGAVPDALAHIAAFDVLCLPSRREGLPTVVLEAMAAGVPVVGTTATGIVDLVDDGRTGLLVAVGDAHALAGALERVLTQDELRRGLISQASAYVRAFAQEEVWRRHRVHYAAVLRLTS
jgi:glycosyltransferase involved in cell wall biosynthesis